MHHRTFFLYHLPKCGSKTRVWTPPQLSSAELFFIHTVHMLGWGNRASGFLDPRVHCHFSFLVRPLLNNVTYLLYCWLPTDSDDFGIRFKVLYPRAFPIIFGDA